MKKFVKLTALALVVLLGVVGCGGGGGGGGADEGPIKLGMVVSETGGAAAYGIHMRNGAEMAVEEINAAGGVNGRQIELIVEDDASDPSTAVSALNRLIVQNGVDAIIGGATSTLCFAIKDIVEEEGVPTITTSGSNPDLTTPENKFFFRLHQSDATAAAQAADFMVKVLGIEKIAVLHDSADYGTGVKDYFVARLKDEYGIEPLIIESYNVGDQDFTPQIVNIRETKPEGIGLFGNIPEAPLATTQIRQLGMEDVEIAMTGISQPRFIELSPGASEGVFAITPFNPNLPDPQVKELAEAYVEKYDMEPPHQVSNTYQTVYVLKQAWENVGTEDKAAVADEMKKIEWTAFGSKNSFDETGQVRMKSVVIQVQDGAWNVYEQQLQ
ncbi:MAG: ABC transporter substrate-binding protein [bacterium]|jgi:branched-chain amino acid transport system substrate-binding protein